MDESHDPRATRSAAERPWTVAQLTQRLRGLFEGLGRISVEGEIGGIKRATSGHLYFDLKDLDARVSCAIWRSQLATALKFDLREGDAVVVHGKLDLYGPRGSYSLIVSRVERAGVGALLAQLEKLKAELKARGWFDRKRELPIFPRTIGVVTSRDGAAFQDFLRTRSLRWPLYPVRLVHTPVQGPGAATQIASAIRRCDASGVDVIVVIRGGGSLEDLWAFNELEVAEAIFGTRAPVVSGVGHETDVTLCDLVADRRAHTPTDAAQTVIPDRRVLEEALERARNHLLEAMASELDRRRERVERSAKARVLRDVSQVFEERRERVRRLERALGQAVRGALERASGACLDLRRRLERRSPTRQLGEREARLAVLRTRATAGVRRALDSALNTVVGRAGQLEALSPTAVLKRGFSITYAAGSRTPLCSAEDVSSGTELVTLLAEGKVISRATEVSSTRDR